MNTMFALSPRATSSVKTTFASFSIGNDSPVKLDSSVFKFTLDNNLISAGTDVPSSRMTISPGTNSSAGIVMILPFLLTTEVGALIFLRASRDFSAFASWIVPINPFNKTTNKIIIGSAISMCSVDQLIPPFEVSKKDKTNDKTAAKIKI